MNTLQQYRDQKTEERETRKQEQRNKEKLTCREFGGAMSDELLIITVCPIDHKEISSAFIDDELKDGVVVRVKIQSIDKYGDFHNNETVRMIVTHDGKNITVDHYVGNNNDKPNWSIERGKPIARKWANHMVKGRLGFDIMKKNDMSKLIEKHTDSAPTTVSAQDVADSLDEIAALLDD